MNTEALDLSILGPALVAGVLVLIDAPSAESGQSEEDFHTMKLITYLCELVTDKKSSWSNRPISLVFTKGDQCENCFEDPTAFARRHTPGLFQQSLGFVDQEGNRIRYATVYNANYPTPRRTR